MADSKGFADLIRKAQSGNLSARAALMDRFGPFVIQICRDISFRGDVALSSSDVIQEGWLRVWEKIHQFQGASDDTHFEAMFFNWLRQTIRSVLLNLSEAQGAQSRKPPAPLVRLEARAIDDSNDWRKSTSPVAHDGTASDIAIADEEARRVDMAIDSLSDVTDRELIRSRFFAEESLAHSAKRLNISYDDARSRFHRALAQLERLLDDSS